VSIALRPIAPDEFEAFARANATGFSADVNLEGLEQTRDYFEFDRSLVALEGEEMAGTTAIFSFDLTVPGGALPTAGVTWVSVKPTHRRRGVLSQMMRRQLSDVRERGEPIAALWASESVIYGRFGYGLAADAVSLTIDRAHAALAQQEASCGRCRFVTRDEALAAWPAVYGRVLREHPGMYSRSQAWWQKKSLREHDRAPPGLSPRFCVQYEEDGEVQGYASYRVRGDSRDGVPNGTLYVRELMAASDAAYAALWRFLFGVDLVAIIEANLRRVDEPLRWMLADPRRLSRRPSDSLWVRLVDVPAALAGRRYAAEGRVVFDVRDGVCSWNAGRYELEAGPEGAVCHPTTDDAGITLDVADLGAVYLGGARLQTLRRAGRVEGDDTALRLADAMFAWEPLPWCPEVF